MTSFRNSRIHELRGLKFGGVRIRKMPKPMVAVIGNYRGMLGPIESCKARLEFVFPEEPNFGSLSRVRGVVFCGLDRFARFRETKPFTELGIVVAVNNLTEYSAAVEAGPSSVLIKPLSGEVLLKQIESQLNVGDERKRSNS